MPYERSYMAIKKDKQPVVKRELQELLLLFEVSQILDQSIELAEVVGPVSGGHRQTDGDDAGHHHTLEQTIRRDND